MPRLPIKTKTQKALFAKAQNKCAFPGCENELIDSDNNIIGQICHIEAAEEGAPRYNNEQTDEKRRHYDNLILFCYEHHKVTDDVEKYTVKTLKQYKADSETENSDSPPDPKIEHAIKKFEHLNTILEKSIGSLSITDIPTKKGYEIFTSDKNTVWMPDQGKFYRTEFGDGNCFEYMMKDDILYLNHIFPDGAEAYYEIDESGGVKENKLPYPISDYEVVIPPDMILREELSKIAVINFTSKRYTLKYGRSAILTFDNTGKLFEANIQARSIVNHQDRTFTIVDPSNVKYDVKELILSTKNQ